ncbi:hypothetical protein GS399_05005 [Pedobacter sp. HMF7647]|uniref:Uncharacterized protein n=1 Tax=Hufsiella arboris TaxID=2695275 RepID=A0A7K1Y6W2_9SPHI|nr:hypothetical protein [Hufsiella arboris]MXV50322.1 hypothetical protein [Hufsiella arboris]
MKTIAIFERICGFMVMLLFISPACKENEDPVPTNDYPKSIRQVLSDQVFLNKLAGAGLTITEDNPGYRNYFMLKGVYRLQHTCVSDNRTPKNLNSTYADYRLDLALAPAGNSVSYMTDDNLDRSTKIDSITVHVDSKLNFTVFFRAAGISNNISYEALWIISGKSPQLQPNSPLPLESMYDCYVILSKGPDPDNKVADVGTVRIFKDPAGSTQAIAASISKPLISEAGLRLSRPKLLTGH